MNIRLFIRYTGIVIFCITAVSAGAKEIAIQHNGLTLNASLELAEGRRLDEGVILLTHGSLAHRDMEMLAYLRKLLRQGGYSSLAINLSLGLDNRHGMYDCKLVHRHHNDDAVDEIGAWMAWLEKQGVRDVTLLGHSRGGAQTALYAAERDSVLVKAVVLLAPAIQENTDAAAYQYRYGEPLAPVLERARMLVSSGNGGSIIEHANLLTCRDTPVTASSFISYYGQDPRLDTPYLLRKISKPTLVVVAGDDKVVVGLDKKVAPLVDGERLQMTIIDGSDHLFRDINTDDAVDAITGFLDGV